MTTIKSVEHDLTGPPGQIDLQTMAWQLKYKKALESQQAFEQLIELLQQYNERTDSDNSDELALSILTLRNQCYDVPTFFDLNDSFDTYFHGVYEDWFLYSTANIKWARDDNSNEATLLDKFPSTIFPIDPLRVSTIVPRIVIEQVLGIKNIPLLHTMDTNKKNPNMNHVDATIDIVIDQI